MSSRQHKVTLKQEDIESIFEGATSQEDYIVGLYSLVVPNFEQVKEVGYPICNETLWIFICGLARKWDEVHCPDVMAGGAWLNWGYSASGESAKRLKDWEVLLPEKIVYKTVPLVVIQEAKS